MQDVRRCSRVTPTNPACKDNTAESINLHPPEILYVANLHVPLFAHRLLSHSTANLATLSLSLPLSISISISLDWKLGLFGFIRYVLEAGRQPLQPFRPPLFFFFFLPNPILIEATPCSLRVFPLKRATLLDRLYFPRIFISSNSRHLSKGLFFSSKKKKKGSKEFVRFFFVTKYFKLRRIFYLFHYFISSLRGEGLIPWLFRGFSTMNEMIYTGTFHSSSFFTFDRERKLVVE